MNPRFVQTHSFSPLIYYIKEENRYKKSQNKNIPKKRPIMYASHRDACILSYYSSVLGRCLETFYSEAKISDSVIAYRALGRGNYHFAAEVYRYARLNKPVAILAYDVTGFFDNLDHALLKKRLKTALGVANLPEDWFKVFRYITRFSFVAIDDMKANPVFAASIAKDGKEPIATIADVKRAGIPFRKNAKASSGIPQGTPISAILSNLYMTEFDVALRSFCDGVGGLYRRYSDDILVICPEEHAVKAEQAIKSLLLDNKLELSRDKTEITLFDPLSGKQHSQRAAQYLGFNFYPEGAGIRPSSLSRQWRKMRRSVKRTLKAAAMSISAGTATKVYTKRLRRRFTALAFRNFSSYARRSAKAFGGDEKITQQVRRFEREVERQLEALKNLYTSQS